MSAILFSAVLGPVAVDLVLKESHEASLGITENPVESGAKITDHSFVEPKKITLEIADRNAADTYNALVRFQETRQPFTFVSGLFVYTNMLIKKISADREVSTHAVLKGSVDLQEIIIVSTAYTASEAGASRQSSAGRTGGTKSTNAARPATSKTEGGTTAIRASSTVQKGDQAAAKTLPVAENRSLLSRLTR